MRAELLGPLGLSLLYLLAGTGIVAATGPVRSPRALLPAAGMAYMAGLAAVLLAGTWLLAVGIPVTLPATAGLAIAIGLGGLAVAFVRGRRGGAPEPAPEVPRPERSRLERALVAVTAAALVVVLALVLRGSVRMDLVEWDAWSIWTRKAVLLLEFGKPELSFFADGRYATMHSDYPLLVPLMEANWFRAVGFADPQGMHGQFWLLIAGFCAAAAWVVGRGGRALAWLPVLLLLITAPSVRSQLLSGYADLPTALLLGLGVLLVGRWLARGETQELCLGVLMLAAAASTKNEGTAAAGAVMAVAVAVAFLLPAAGRSRWRSAMPALLGLAALAASLAPWRLWMARHGITGDMPISQGLDPSYLASRDERVVPALKGLLNAMSSQNDWQYLLPLGAAAALTLLLLGGPGRRAGAFYAGSGALILASLVWAYWISPQDLAYHLDTSVGRVVASVVLVGVASALHVAAGPPDPVPDGEPPPGDAAAVSAGPAPTRVPTSI